MHATRSAFRVLLLAGLFLAAGPLAGQDAKSAKAKRPDFIPADYNDYQNMLDQLGIKKVRRGRDGRGKDTSDEATANTYKDSMPELMTFKDGTKVKSADQWPRRRAEIVEEFEREVYGRIPKNVPAVKWEVTRTEDGDSGGIATVTRTLAGRVDNSGFPALEVTIQASVTVPKLAAGPVPVLLQFGVPPGAERRAPWARQAIAKGWGHGTIVPNSIQPDYNPREGIIGLTNKGEPRKPDDWGALRAWGWGVSRLIDYFEAHKDVGVDPAKVCITGVSRYGKAALVATAFDTRVAAGFVASSGAGGAKLFRRDFGELLENVAGGGEYHWMAGNFVKYAADEASFGKKTAADLPVDQHELIALCAPRLCFISYGIPPGDPNWVDAHGSFMAAVLAGPAYRLLGKKDLGTPGNYLTDPMPPVNTLIGGELAWRQHNGGHTNLPNFPAFFEWAGRYISSPGLRDEARGKRLFEGQCARCHGMEGGGGIGANLRRPKLRRANDNDSLVDLVRSGIPGTGMPFTFAMTDEEVRDVVAYVRSLGRIPPEPVPGDAEQGRLVYQKAGCGHCHIIAGQGGNLGPELSDVGGRRGVAFLREALLHPGKDRAVSSDGYATFLPILAATKAGRVLTGFRVNEDTFTIQVRDTDNRLHSLHKGELEELHKLDGSVMPSFEKTLARSDVDNLVSYLANLK